MGKPTPSCFLTHPKGLILLKFIGLLAAYYIYKRIVFYLLNVVLGMTSPNNLHWQPTISLAAMNTTVGGLPITNHPNKSLIVCWLWRASTSYNYSQLLKGPIPKPFDCCNYSRGPTMDLLTLYTTCWTCHNSTIVWHCPFWVESTLGHVASSRVHMNLVLETSQKALY